MGSIIEMLIVLVGAALLTVQGIKEDIAAKRTESVAGGGAKPCHDQCGAWQLYHQQLWLAHSSRLFADDIHPDRCTDAGAIERAEQQQDRLQERAVLGRRIPDRAFDRAR